MSKVTGSARALDARREELETERAFLLASIADLEAERDAGAIDDATFAELHDDYTARAAAVIRALDAPQPARSSTPTAAAPKWRTPVVVAVIIVFLIASGAVLWNAVADRKAGQTATGGPTATQSPNQQRALLEGDVARQPSNAAARRALARFLLTQQDYAGALREFDQAAALDPKDAESRAYAGWVTHLAGLDQRALLRLDAATAIDPGYADAYFFRGIVYFRGLGQAARAIPEFEQFLTLAPESPIATQVEGVLSAARQAVAATTTTVSTTNAPK